MLSYKIEEDAFWYIVNQLCALEAKSDLETFLKSKNVEKKNFAYVCDFLSSINHPLDIREEIIYPLHLENVHVSFTMKEWISLQALFPRFEQFEHLPFFGAISAKLSQVESENSHLDIFEFLSTKNNNENIHRILPLGLENLESKIKFLEEAILDNNGLEILTTQNQRLKILPLQLVFIGGQLELVCENIIQNSLESFNLLTLEAIFDLDEEIKSQFSQNSLTEFISQLREIENKTLRLVLKIHSLENFELKCKGELFSKPCMFANSEGQNIWAATIEPSEQIYEWILALNGDVEILSPNDFKKDFLEYCEKKVDKIA